MPTTYKFTPFSGAKPWTVTFDDDDQMIGADDPPFEVSKEEMSQFPARWWNTAYYNNASIAEVGEEDEEPEVGKFDVVKLDADKRLVFGWAYVTHDESGNVMVDKSGEYVDDAEELERAAYEFVIKSRRAGDMHQADFTAGTMVESMVFTPEKLSKLGLPEGSLPTGWWVGFKIENDTVWQSVKNGERPAFSIHGKASKEATGAA